MTIIEPQFYVTGGALQYDARSYVRRQADHDLYAGLRQGEFCYVLTSRQMGKTSLMVQTAARLRADGVKVAVLDLTAIGQNLTAEQWYNGLLGQLGQHLGIEDDLEDYWFDLADKDLGPLQRWMQAIRKLVLPNINSSLVIFVDEIDVVRTLHDLNPQFSTDEFFAGIRAFYNLRTEDPELHRLTFCLLGVATPSDLIQDTRMTPFNIGKRIELRDFTENEATPLAQGLGTEPVLARKLLNRVLYWTGGHPYLTQRLCRALAEDVIVNNHEAAVDRLCEELFLSTRARVADDNLNFVRDRLLRSEADLTALLFLYKRVRRGKQIRDDEANPLISILRLAGIVRTVEGRLAVRNQIYGHVFDPVWVDSQLPDAELIRRRKIYRQRLVVVTATALLIIAYLTYSQVKEIKARRLAESLQQRAEGAEQTIRQMYYAASVSAAQQMWENGNVERMLELLKGQMPEAGSADLRGFEWYYLWRLCHSESQSWSHPDEVRAVAFAATGKRFASGSNDGSVKIWELGQATEIRRLNGHEGAAVNTLAFLPDGRSLATGGDDQTVKIWNPEKSEPMTLSGHTGSVRAIFVAPDQQRLITGSDDGQIFLWDTRSWQRVGRFKEARRPIISFALSADGQTLALGSGQGTVELWDTQRQQKRAHLNLPLDAQLVNALAFSPDNRTLVAGCSSGFIYLWKLNDLREMQIFRQDNDSVFALAFSPDGRQLAVGSDNRTVALVDVATQKLTANFKGHLRAVQTLAFAPDGQVLLSGGRDGAVKTWNLGQPQEQTLPVEMERVQTLALAPDQSWLAAGNGAALRLWPLSSPEKSILIAAHQETIAALTFAPDSKHLATASEDQTVKLWDLATQQAQILLSGVGEMLAVAYSPDGKLLAAGGLGTDQPIDQTEGQDRVVWLWDAATGRELGRLREHKDRIQALAFSPDSRSLATASRGGVVILWDMQTLRKQAALKIHDQPLPLNAIAFSPDGRLLAVGSDDGLATFWDVASRQMIVRLKGHTDAISALAFAPDGRSLVTASKDKTLKFWEVQRGQELATFKDLTSEVLSLAFSPDAQMLVTGRTTGGIRIWRAPRESLQTKN